MNAKTGLGLMRSSVALVVSTGLAVAALSGCSGDAAPAANAEVTSEVRTEASLRDTIRALMAQARVNDREFGGQLSLPAIWLFDPNGQQQLQAVSEADSDRLVAVAKGDQAGNAAEGALDLATLAQALDPALGIPHPHAGRDRWTAVVWMTDRDCSPICERMKQAASELESHAEVVTVTLLTAQ